MEIEFIIILIIGSLQFGVFIHNCRKLQLFKNIFPNASKFSINKGVDGAVIGIASGHGNSIFGVIQSSINQYLSNNKGKVSDYHLIKDIVDRNTDAKEDEINTLIPIPLYLGLIGTMGCILFGLKNLNLNSVVGGSENAMIDGISPLLSGVAVAMITSIIGIILTTLGSYFAKNSRAKVEKGKNDFLSWMQAELLPELSNDTAGALQKMTQNLSDFNNAFSRNNAQFTATLSKVADTSDKQAELITLISQLQDKRITVKNLELLRVLEKWIVNLSDIKNYNDRLSNQLVNVGDYFKAEREQIEQRKEAFENLIQDITTSFTNKLPEAFNKADANSQKALDAFNTHLNESLKKITETLEEQISGIYDNLTKQQNELQDSFNLQNETQKQALATQHELFLKNIENSQNSLSEALKAPIQFVEQMNTIADKMASITRLETAMNAQNSKLDRLADNIEKLAQSTSGVTLTYTMPKWQKLLIVAIAGIVGLSGLFYLLSTIF
jgi:hypothetical protein